jgi:hypothetical protein
LFLSDEQLTEEVLPALFQAVDGEDLLAFNIGKSQNRFDIINRSLNLLWSSSIPHQSCVDSSLPTGEPMIS